MLNLQKKQGGFSLVELLVGLAVLGILMSVALPNFQTWIVNTRISSAAEAIASGLQRARAEAVARNTNVAFSTLGIGTAWNVYTVAPASEVDAKSALEGSTDVTLASTPVGSTTVTFTGLGLMLNTNTATTINPATSAVVPAQPFTSIDFVATGGSRNLRVVVTPPGGTIKVCDPHAASGSTSAC